MNGSGNEITNPAHIGHINPIRYRGYYYDTETGLYYLRARYYDPETGRFISQDNVSFLDPEHLAGLNLYAYCGNNPVMFTDPSGQSVFLTMLIIGIVTSAAIGGTMNGISAYNDGQRGLGLFGAIAGGAIMGGAMGGILVLGGASGLSAAITPSGLSITGFGLTTSATLGISMAIGIGAGLASYSIESSLRTDRSWVAQDFALAGISGGVKALSTFGIGYIGGKVGAFDKMLFKPMLKGVLTESQTLTYAFTKGILSTALPGIGRQFMDMATWYLGENLAKIFLFSSAASGARWLIDKILGT